MLIELDSIMGDGVLGITMPVKWEHRKHDIYWNYDLDEKDYEIKLVARDLKEGIRIDVSALIVYSDTDSGNITYF